MIRLMEKNSNHKFITRWEDQKGRTVECPAYDPKQAVAIGRARSCRETFRVYTEKGQIYASYVDGKTLNREE